MKLGHTPTKIRKVHSCTMGIILSECPVGSFASCVQFHNIIITWECYCFNSHWSHETIFMEITLYRDLSQEVAESVSHGKFTVGSWCRHVKTAGPFMGCSAAEDGVAKNATLATIWDKLRFFGFVGIRDIDLSDNCKKRNINNVLTDSKTKVHTWQSESLFWEMAGWFPSPYFRL